MKRKNINIAAALIMTVMLTGCVRDTYPWNTDAKDELAVKYMNGRYGGNFVISTATRGEYTWEKIGDPYDVCFTTVVTDETYKNIENTPEDEKPYLTITANIDIDKGGQS